MQKKFLETELKILKDKDIYRSLSIIETSQGPRIIINGRECILFCSNNYLGLADHPDVKEAAIKAIERYGVGSGASRLISGSMNLHMELEERLARFKGTESALLFNSGYHANLGIITALAGKGDFIFSDKLNHASIVDGCILSGAVFKRYPHKNLNVLEGLLKKHSAFNIQHSTLIVTDAVFSMDGDIAPLKEILELSEKYGVMLMVDDAHATGVFGRNGSGTLEYLGIENPDIIQMGTLGKAIGSFGAYAAGSRKLIDYLINKARPFIYTTALPPSVCAASIAAIDIIERAPELRQNLWDRIWCFRKELKEAGIKMMSEESHIIPLFIGDAKKTVEISNKLFERGIFIQAVRPPTVPEGTSRLRITLMANHSWDDMKYAFKVIKEMVK
ncbi:MAG: 8-amino-7-oxononanoate synthase [Deltaproteobacteria bacterium]|nr:8-amino-7-oxononanoate synthase [Deltaproteobacteria bacterium]